MFLNKKILLLIFAVLSSIALHWYYSSVFEDDEQETISNFQEEFIRMEDQLLKEIEREGHRFKFGNLDKNWTQEFSESKIFIHAYRNDSLKFWNTNQLPILRFAEIHFPAEGLIHLQNGWYYGKIEKLGEITVCGTFLIKQDYSYQNKDLENVFASNFSMPVNSEISLDQEVKGAYKIKNKKGDFIFSLIPNQEKAVSHTQSSILLTLFITVVILWFYLIHLLVKDKIKWGVWLLLPLVVAVRLVLFKWEMFGYLTQTDSIDPTLFASSEWYPTFADYLLNVLTIVYSLYVFKLIIEIIPISAWKKYLVLFLPLVFIPAWYLIDFLLNQLIENSTIPLAINEVFSLNLYSFLAIASIGAVFYAFIQLMRQIYSEMFNLGWSGSMVAMLTFVVGSGFFLIELFDGKAEVTFALLPSILVGIIYYRVYFRQDSFNMASGVVILFLFTITISTEISELNYRKEHGERELYANQFATEKSINAEVEYLSTSQDLKDDNFLKRQISSRTEIGSSDFQEGLERRVFNGFWERYEIGCVLFGLDGTPLVKDQDIDMKYLDQIISTSGSKSEISSHMYFVDDYKDKYSYIIKEKLYGKDSTQAYLYVTLKSKKIPEEIGFPRLLISEKANVTEPLKNYSIAKYHGDTLITKYGEFSFPSRFSVMNKNVKLDKGFFEYDGFDHFFLKRGGHEVLLVSRVIPSDADYLTTFSYLFSFFGLLLLPFMFRLNIGSGMTRKFGLALRIQIVLIGLVFISLLAFGWGSGMFVRNQYNDFTNDVIKEKLNSVQIEVKTKLGHLDYKTLYENTSYMQYILQKFAKVFYTDINLYSKEGYLLASSRPKVFNKGLLSEQMNPEAYKHLNYFKKSEYVHKEQIGKLVYSSAYQPFYNVEGKQLGFINLQHFGQQREFENQIEKFLVAIINVFIALLAISVIMAVFISNWLTKPLRVLQESFAKVKFGQHNERIMYSKEDEIGALVKEYNQKLDELEFTAEQLAQSERESAWREMAKQVAHEIKNPLTPMKLSVQHLLRSYDPSDPGSQDKLNRVANSIIEQIDALTNIANEFSNFAKMPEPAVDKADLISLINGVVAVFSGSETEIIWEPSIDEVHARIDKDQFVRVFNNLIKNGIQAIPENRKGKIEITLEITDQIVIRVSDNGMGIPKNKRAKIFVPYFTTKSTGTGLGLAMVKQIIENHQGSVDFESEYNVGTTFVIQLPMVK